MPSSHRAHNLQVRLPQDSPAVPLERESGPELCQPHAAVVVRTANPSSALLDALMAELGITNGELARDMRCTEKIVRDLRAGARPITIARIETWRASVRVAFLRVLLLRAEARLPKTIDLVLEPSR